MIKPWTLILQTLEYIASLLIIKKYKIIIRYINEYEWLILHEVWVYSVFFIGTGYDNQLYMMNYEHWIWQTLEFMTEKKHNTRLSFKWINSIIHYVGLQWVNPHNHTCQGDHQGVSTLQRRLLTETCTLKIHSINETHFYHQDWRILFEIWNKKMKHELFRYIP